MSESMRQTSVPQEADAVAQGVKKLVLAIVANHKAAAASGTAFEVSADVSAAVADLGGPLAGIGALSSELSARKLGVGKALAIGCLEAAEVLSGELQA